MICYAIFDNANVWEGMQNRVRKAQRQKSSLRKSGRSRKKKEKKEKRESLSAHDQICHTDGEEGHIGDQKQNAEVDDQQRDQSLHAVGQGALAVAGTDVGSGEQADTDGRSAQAQNQVHDHDDAEMDGIDAHSSGHSQQGGEQDQDGGDGLHERRRRSGRG